MKKRNEHQPQLAAPLKIVPVPLEEAKDDRKLSFHSVNRAQHFRERAQIAEREAKYCFYFFFLP